MNRRQGAAEISSSAASFCIERCHFFHSKIGFQIKAIDWVYPFILNVRYNKKRNDSLGRGVFA